MLQVMGTTNILINFTIVEPYLDEHRLCKLTSCFFFPRHIMYLSKCSKDSVWNPNTHAHAPTLVTAGDRRSDKSRKFEHMLAKKKKQKTSTTKTNNWYNDMRVHVCIILNSKWIKIAGQGVPCIPMYVIRFFCTGGFFLVRVHNILTEMKTEHSMEINSNYLVF